MKTKHVLASLLLILTYAIPVMYYFWAVSIAEISWGSWAGIPLFLVVIGPISCFFAVATFAYWWEIAVKKAVQYHLFPVVCMFLALCPIIVYCYLLLTRD